MAIYAIGDVQGCYDDLRRLLDAIAFDPALDQVWFAGDLVNRGPKSCQVLRFVQSLGNSAITVLGNHDLHLIATFNQLRPLHKKDTLRQVLQAQDGDELVHWLRHRPLFHQDAGFCMLHAGLPPQWDGAKAAKMAAKAEKVLQGAACMDFLQNMYDDKPRQWSDDLNPQQKIRFIVNCFTRMRYCCANGRLSFKQHRAPGSQPPHLLPWFRVASRKSADLKIIFGHWSALGFHQENNCFCIDTGAVWGGQLTALQLGKCVRRISVDCSGI